MKINFKNSENVESVGNQRFCPLTTTPSLFMYMSLGGCLVSFVSHSNHVTSSKRADTLICHTTMCRNPIKFLYNSGHVIL